jgi:LacI family transcriptional regulator
MTNAFARESIHGIRRYIREHGPWILRFSEQGRGGAPPRWLKRWRGDGILARIDSRELAEAVEETGLPVVDLAGCGLLPSMPSVEVDNEVVAQFAAEHFLERGFRHFGYCGLGGFPWSRLRGAHFSRFVAKAGFACRMYESRARTSRLDPWLTDPAGLARWIQGLPRPAGILCAWDGCAIQVLDVCRSLSMAVPEDLAVLGVDDDELLCDLADPPLSSVAIGPRQTGYQAAALLDRMMAGLDVQFGIHLMRPAGVVTRQSTDVLAIEDREVSDAARFIRENACNSINVSDVLAVVPLSRSSLEVRFKKHLGRTPHEEILRVQLRRVKELLTETDLPLTTIAERTGFAHVEYLSVVFKKETGIPPGRYRRQSGRQK